MMRAYSPGDRTAIPGKRRVEFLAAEERLCRCLDKPLGALKGPATADPLRGIGGHRGIPNERNARARGGADLVRHVELADELGAPLAGAQIRPVRERPDEVEVGALRIGSKLRQPLF